MLDTGSYRFDDYQLRPGKTAVPDALHYNVFEYPCEQRAPFGAENICVYPITDYQPPPS